MNIKEKRLSMNYTMKQVADMVNISEGMYSLIESEKRRPSVKVAKSLGLVLGVEWTDFFNDVKAELAVNL